MNIKVLRYFLALAKEQSVTAAAEYLHLTQPTLSRQLSELEEELGTTLFIRGSRKITLTEDGVLLRKRAEDILDLVQKTQAEFHKPSETVSGDIYIGGGESYAMGLVVDAIKALRQDYPQIRVHIYSGNAEDVTERIDKGLLDFGILIAAPNLSHYESMTLPVQDTWGLLMRRDDPLANQDAISREDLLRLPLISSRQGNVGSSLSHWLKKEYNSLNVVATYNLIFNATLMVEKGIGYGLCLDRLVNTTGDSKLCFRPLRPALGVNIDVVWQRYQVFSKPAERFLAYLKRHLTHPVDR